MSRQRPLGRDAVGAGCIAAAATLWGLWPLWVRGAGIGGPATATIALLVAGGLALPFALRAGVRARREGGGRPGKAWLLLGVLGGSNAMNSWFYFKALDEGAIAPAALSHYLAPVLVALVAPWLLGEARSSRTPVALALALGGTAVLLFGGGAGGASGADAEATRIAVTLGAASAAFYAANVIMAKVASRHFANVEIFAWHALVGAAVLAPLSGLPGDLYAWRYAVAGGLVSTLLPGMLYYMGLRRLPAERAGVLTYLEIPAAVVVGWIALGEQPAAVAAVGGVAILAAGLLVVTAPPS